MTRTPREVYQLFVWTRLVTDPGGRAYFDLSASGTRDFGSDLQPSMCEQEGIPAEMAPNFGHITRPLVSTRLLQQHSPGQDFVGAVMTRFWVMVLISFFVAVEIISPFITGLPAAAALPLQLLFLAATSPL